MQAHLSNVNRTAACSSCGEIKDFFAKRFLATKSHHHADVYVCVDCAQKYLVMDEMTGCYSLINKE